MKKSNLLQSLFVAFLLVFTTLNAHAELLLTENFNYSTGNLYGQGTSIDPTGLGWIRYGSHTANVIQVVDGALSYAGYQETATGKAARITNGGTTDEDLQFAFSKDPITSGSFYASMLVNITDAGQGDKPAYFIAFTGKTSKGWVDGVNATEYGRIFSIKSGEGKFQLGISKNNAAPSVTTEDLDLGKTYLLVLKYEFIDGSNNDITSLWVNPADFKNEPTTTLIGTISQGDASATNGLQGIEIRQGQNFERLTPTATIDAIRVATTWAELFNQTAGGEDQDPVPAISVNTTSIEFEGTMFVGGPAVTKTVNVKATDLTADITITTTSANLTVEPATITKEAAMSETGANVVVTFTPNSIETGFPNVVFASEGATEVKVPVSVYVVNAVANLGEMVAKAKEEGYYYGAISGEIAVTHSYTQSGQNCLYIQDATAAFLVYDTYENMGDLKAGDRFTGASVYYGGGEFYIESIGKKGENKAVEPEDVTLAELATNEGKAKYAFRLVRVSNVKFSATGKFESQQYDITQGGTTAKMSFFTGSEIIGTDIPGRADIVGVVRNANGNLISPRTTADISAIAATPTISVSQTAVDFGETIFVLGGTSATTKITVKGADLTGDITITSSSQNLTATPTTIAKADAMTEAGVEVTLTFTPLAVEWDDPYITIRSEGATQVQVQVAAFVNDAVADLAAMKAKIETEGFFMGYITGEIAVSQAYDFNGLPYFYVQDATAALMMTGEAEVVGDLVAGDRLTMIGAYYEGGTTFSIASIGTKGENKAVEPDVVTLTELTSNAAQYAFRLVRINDITFSQTGDFAFGTQYDIAQGEAVAKLSLFAESDIIGTQLPSKADVIGIVRNATGKLISPRTTEDIIDKSINTSLADAYAAQVYTETGMLCIVSEAETAVSVYTMLGAEIATVRATTGTTRIALEQGIYIVRINGKATKVIVK
ncbi:MAG: DUF6383 domain-containing protein [Bacteroidales bacterium]|nr:DUF6383 domain-containing protein [Bacteroidales bacterium]